MRKKQRLGKIKDKVDSITKTATSVNKAHAHKIYNTDCLAVSNGICTKRNMARFARKKVNNNSDTIAFYSNTSSASNITAVFLAEVTIPDC